ncbi:MAG: ABC transporter permease [Moraxellaceae bacterium]|nr:ABC transporter permease [Moraxellaceae bacterium]
MTALLHTALRSAWNRRFALSLTLLSIALATALLLGVQRVRHDVRDNFVQSVSGTDLVVGARGGSVPLMLYAVFRLGDATADIRWQSAQWLAQHPAVAWTLPLAMGDSYRGFPVLGTTTDYFTHYRYGDAQSLRLQDGRAFGGTTDTLFEAVLGAEVAERLDHRTGDRLTLTHGSAGLEGAEHADKPFTVVGVLARTGTAVDRTVHISLQGIEAIHVDWAGGMPMPGMSIPPELVRKFDLTPKRVTAVLVGLKSRAQVFAMQRAVAGYADEPLMGVMPGVALDELWQVVSVGERVMLLVSALVVAVGLVGLVATILAGLDARRRELAVLRAVGARPLHILLLLALEGLLVTVAGVLLGGALLALLSAGLGPWVEAQYGVALRSVAFNADELGLLAAIIMAGTLASLVPAARAYRLSLADGLSQRF